ncbi:MAG: hypothetical protein MEEGG_02922 [Eggerthella lenta]
MANDPVLGMLGLARRAGKLAAGDELVKELCAAGKARAVFLAGDAGASAAKRAAGYAERARVPLFTLPQDKETLGAAIGRAQSAVCAVSDIGMAAATAAKLAAADGTYAEAAAQLAQKNTRIQFRKGKKKKSALSGADKPNKQNITTEVSANGD